MIAISLDRRFYEWQEGPDSLAHSRYRLAAGLSDGMFGWPELLAKRRVVILAEAGSGKTVELTQQARQQAAAGKFAFYATVQDVGRDGLDKALHFADRERLAAWRTTALRRHQAPEQGVVYMTARVVLHGDTNSLWHLIQVEQ